MAKATTASESGSSSPVRKSYPIRVHNIEACNCNHGCNCQFGGLPDHGGCEAIIGGEVIEGSYGDVPLAGTVGRLEGPISKPIEMRVNGTKSEFEIPGLLALRQTPIRDAVSGQEKEVQIVYPKGGFFWDTGNVATTAETHAEYGPIRFRHPGGFASYATPTWTNQQ